MPTEGIRPELSRVTLGIVPLIDCAPIVIALEKDLFARHGLDVTLSHEPSWANIRDKVSAGALDGAHMLAGMPLAATLGVGGLTMPMTCALVLSGNGNCITVSRALHARMQDADPVAMATPATTARALRAVVEADRRAGRAPLTFAMTFPVATHNYELRGWLVSGGIDPATDVNIVVVPPPQMAAHLIAGRIDGYCVGEPWNGLAVERDAARIVVTKRELLGQAPEKVFAVTRDWSGRHPETHRALLAAMIEAAAWLDADSAHRAEAAELLCAGYVDAPVQVVARALQGAPRRAPGADVVVDPDFILFHRGGIGCPRPSYAAWTIEQMRRWGQLERSRDTGGIAEQVYRPDLYRSAAAIALAPDPMVPDPVVPDPVAGAPS